MPTLDCKTYTATQEKLIEAVSSTAWESMAAAGKEERDHAISTGSIDANGVPLITVVADGAWSKRSYKNKYDAHSGCVSSNNDEFIIYCYPSQNYLGLYNFIIL